MQTRWLVNGRESRVDPTDRGLAYGDGLFETMAMRSGRIRWFDEHYERLQAGCSRLSIPCPSAAEIGADVGVLAHDSEASVIKLIVTRGSGARGYRPPTPASCTRIVIVDAWPNYPAQRYDDGIELAVCKTPIGENVRLAGLKHLCRLEQVLGQAELEALSAVEGLMLTSNGLVIGGTMSNVFCAVGGVLYTPRLDRAGVSGVMRRIVIRKATEANILVREQDLTLDRFESADEVFVTNAVFGLWPVAAIGAMKVRRGTLALELMREIGIGNRDEQP